jgi:hypothetical protein
MLWRTLTNNNLWWKLILDQDKYCLEEWTFDVDTWTWTEDTWTWTEDTWTWTEDTWTWTEEEDPDLSIDFINTDNEGYTCILCN